MIKNVKVFGIEDSVKASKYPMSVDTEKCTDEIVTMTKKLAQCPKGTGHDQFLTGIIVQFDLTLSLKAWTEAQRYHFLDFVSSQSTMHRITKMDIDKQCNEYVEQDIIDIVWRLVSEYNENKSPENYLRVLYNVPAGFRLTARMTTNYRQLKTIYSQRKDHRLPEWRMLCKWITTLPLAEELIIGEE